MIIIELIEFLQQLDPNMLVVVANDDGALDAPTCEVRMADKLIAYWDKDMNNKFIPKNIQYLEL